MADSVPIVPELTFRAQIYELASFLARTANDQALSQAFEQACRPAEGQTELENERKQQVVRMAVDKVVELKGGLEVLKEADVESSYLLLLYVLSSTFQPTTSEHDQLVEQVVSAVEAGGKEASEAQKVARLELAARVQSHIYNSLPSSSPSRRTVLLALLRLLVLSGDLSPLNLTTLQLTQMLAQWSLLASDAAAFLTSVSGAYEATGQLGKAVEVLVLALEQGDSKAAERALVLTVADEGRFGVEEVARVKGSTEALQGPAKELAALFTGTDELQAVEAGQKWVQTNGAWIQGFSIPQLNAEAIVSKLRLIALATACARAQTRQLSYADIAAVLRVDESEVESWVIDAVSAKLINARLSQPTSTVRITSVSSAASRQFGPEAWQLLERRLGEWKVSVEEARQAIGEAEAVAAQGPITHQRRGPRQQGGAGGERERAQDTEVAA